MRLRHQSVSCLLRNSKLRSGYPSAASTPQPSGVTLWTGCACTGLSRQITRCRNGSKDRATGSSGSAAFGAEGRGGAGAAD